jgi:hypothetical protein
MKIRQGFVSNSSSTSFYFITKKGSKEELFKMMRKYSKCFDGMTSEYFEEYQPLTTEIIISAIDGLTKITQYSVLELVSHFEEQLESDREWSKKYPNDNYSREDTYRKSNRILFLISLHEKGFKSVFDIGFGDHDGDISGGQIGNIMDYEGRTINLNEDDFVIFTEQAR